MCYDQAVVSIACPQSRTRFSRPASQEAMAVCRLCRAMMASTNTQAAQKKRQRPKKQASRAKSFISFTPKEKKRRYSTLAHKSRASQKPSPVQAFQRLVFQLLISLATFCARCLGGFETAYQATSQLRMTKEPQEALLVKTGHDRCKNNGYWLPFREAISLRPRTSLVR